MKTNESFNKEELKFFKTIKIRTILIESGNGLMKFKNREVFGTIHYIRKGYPKYDYLLGDELDLAILKQAKAQFLNAELIINEPLIFQEQKEYFLSLNNHTLIHNLTVNICPKFNLENGIQPPEISFFNFSSIKLNIYLQTYYETQTFDKIDLFTNFKFHIPIDYKKIDQIKSTIESHIGF